MPQVSLSPFAGVGAQFFDNNGVILTGGKIYSYAAGTTTPLATYTSLSGATPHANPIVLDSAGRVPGGEIWLEDGQSYKFVVETAAAVLIGTYDNVNAFAPGFITITNHVGNGANTVFGIGSSPTTKLATDVYINGVYQDKNTYTINGSNLTFTQAPPVNAQIEIVTQQTTVLGTTSADLVSYTANGVNAVQSTVDDKLNGLVSPSDYLTMQNALNSYNVTSVYMGAPGIYNFSGASLTSHKTIDGNNSVLLPQSNAPVFTLNGFSPLVNRVYMQANTDASDYYINMQNTRGARIANIYGANTGFGGINCNPSTDCSVTWLDNVFFEDVTSIGFNIGSRTNKIKAQGCEAFGKIDFVGGLGKPRAGSIGWRQNTPLVGGIAVGGHQIINSNMEVLDIGWWFTDAQLTKLSNCIADGTSDYGVRIDGASQYLEISDLFVGTSRGIYVGGTSTSIFFTGLKTLFTGLIPPWGAANFFNGVTTFYDLTVDGTASVRVSGWSGTKAISVAPTAKLIVDDGENYEGKSVGTIAAGTTTFLGVQGQSTTINDVQWRAPYDCYILRLMPTVGAAPGVGETFTYTAFVSGVATSLVATISDAAFGGVDTWAGTLVPVAKGATINIQLVTSGAAAATRHSCILQIAPR